MIAAVLDRIEGDQAVLLFGEEEKQIIFPKKYLPSQIVEGDYLNFEITIDQEATAKAKREAASLLEKLKEQNQ